MKFFASQEELRLSKTQTNSLVPRLLCTIGRKKHDQTLTLPSLQQAMFSINLQLSHFVRYSLIALQRR